MTCTVKNLITLIGLVFFILISLGSTETLTSEAIGDLSHLKVEPSTDIINGEFDAGYLITFVVTNRGKTGPIKIRPSLSSSEGEWSRSQTINFNRGESKRFSYFFHEPSISATNIYESVRLTPRL